MTTLLLELLIAAKNHRGSFTTNKHLITLCLCQIPSCDCKFKFTDFASDKAFATKFYSKGYIFITAKLLNISYCNFFGENHVPFYSLCAGLGCPKNTKVVEIISATILSPSVPTGELPKKISDKSEHPKGSLKLIEILGEITKEIGPNFSVYFDSAVTF